MRVIHLNNQLEGGAAIGAQRILNATIQKGVQGKLIYAHGKDHGLDEHLEKWEFERLSSIWSKYQAKKYYRNINKYLSGRDPGYEHYSYAAYVRKTVFPQLLKGTNLIQLHQVDNFLDYESFFGSIPGDLPIIWSLHDMEPFTGGCHYSWDCTKYLENCNSCPQLGNYRNGDLSHKCFQIKQRALKDIQLHVVGNSTWTTELAKESPLLGNAKSYTTVHYGLNTEVCRPVEKDLARKALGIPEDSFVICFGASDINNKRKGFSYLLSCLKEIYAEIDSLFLVTFGVRTEAFLNGELGSKHFGFVQDEELKSLIYSSADLFLSTALYEAFGQTSAEALASATPVIAFRSGGLVDIVKDKKTGILTSPKDVSSLAKAIISCYQNPEFVKGMSREARSFVMNHFTIDKCGEGYMNVYQKALQGLEKEIA